MLIPSTISFASDSRGSSETSKANSDNWVQPKNETQYWGNATRNIASDKDQADLDSQVQPIPGLTVASAKVFEMKGASLNGAAASTTSLGSGKLLDRGGAVLPTVTIHPIYWGPSSTLTPTYISKVSSFLTGLTCSGCSAGLSGMLLQYSRGASINISVGKPYTDSALAPPTSSPSTTALANEVVKVVSTVAKDPIDPTGLYLVFTSNFPSRASYCAFHGAASVRIANVTTSFAFGYMPNLSNQLSGCGAHYLPGYATNLSNLGESYDSLFNVTTHELYEAMTDPLTRGNGWYDVTGYEIGDKCAWNWSTPITSGGINFVVQQEYSNSLARCASA